MSELMFGISGVRGIVGETLTNKVITDVGKAFGTFVCKHIREGKYSPRKAKIAIAQDTRRSSKSVKKSFIKGVLTTGCDIIDMGTISTPTLLFNISKTKAKSGAMITASHNPGEWNGIKFVNSKGRFIGEEDVAEIYQIYKNKDFLKGESLKIIKDNNGEKRHILGIMDSIDREVIKNYRFKVAISSPWLREYKEILCSLGCEVIGVSWNTEEEDKRLSIVSQEVVRNQADVGFITDSDGDRLIIISEKGKVFDSEYTLPLVGSWILKYRKGLVVTNLSTSMMIEDIAQQNGCTLKRTKVGEINVVQKMVEEGAIFGGEGNGGIIDPFIHYTRDALIGICRVLEYMAGSEKSISKLIKSIPKYSMVKKTVEWRKRDVEDFSFLSKLFPDAKLNEEDGIKMEFKKGWVHIRKSNTEPVIRIICETKNLNSTNSIVNKIIKGLKK